MLKRAKWVKSNQAHEPISHVAAVVIRERLNMVWEYAPLAAKKWEEEPEFLHQMRVGTRRSAAALVTFAELLPPNKTRRMHKRLKRLRKSSGEARDLDVLIERLQKQNESGGGHGPSLAKLHEMRAATQSAIVQAVDRLAERDFPRKVTALCDRIRWRSDSEEPTYAEEARRLMSREVENFVAAASKDLSDNNSLHALRIEGKQMRYTMEVLAGAFDSHFRQELYGEMRELQDKLGEINDHAAAEQRFHTWALQSVDDVATNFEQLAAAEREITRQKRENFLQWWTDQRSQQLTNKLRDVA
jgi:CHAD domain-containing protein